MSNEEDVCRAAAEAVAEVNRRLIAECGGPGAHRLFVEVGRATGALLHAGYLLRGAGDNEHAWQMEHRAQQLQFALIRATDEALERFKGLH